MVLEMISNLPFDNNASNYNCNIDLYSGFVNKIPELIKPGGMVFLYTVERKLLEETLIDNEHLQLIDQIKIESGTTTPHVFALKVN